MIQERYIRWVLEERTPGYMVREEGKRDKMGGQKWERGR